MTAPLPPIQHIRGLPYAELFAQPLGLPPNNPGTTPPAGLPFTANFVLTPLADLEMVLKVGPRHTLTGWTIAAHRAEVGTIEFAVSRCLAGTYPGGLTLTNALTPPQIATPGTAADDTTLAGWTRDGEAGDLYLARVVAVNGFIEPVLLALSMLTR